MTNLNGALKNARLAIPLNRRIWNFLADNPAHSSVEIAAALSVPRGNVSSCLSDMEKRTMLDRTKESTSRRHGTRGMASYRYIINPRMRGQFEILPRVNGREPDPVMVADIHPTPPPPRSSIIDSLSAREALAAYHALRTMFKRGGAQA